ncbi:poly(ADP-ribose) glycohydrolase isoform X1 [Brachyhypopomus gauderio]|uniref:poly(ADP-ribose) glycohydrolase isoform X1 n=1 Tax=Brachyhypopomus gauderio TaxID=698409 RepID=UPI0040425944
MHLIMAHKNDSSQVKECLNHTQDDKSSEAGSGPSSSKEQSSPRHNPCTEPAGSGPPPDAEGKPATTIGELKKEPECHMQLDHLCPCPRHTVLIDTDQFRKGKLVPYTGPHVWDSNHVKLPLINVKSTTDSRWSDAQKALKKLTTGCASVGDVEEAIHSYNQKHSREWHFDALYSYVKDVQKKENNFSTVIPRMAQLALELPAHIKHPIPLLRQNRNHSITLSQVQISCLLANAFFCTFPHRNSTRPGSEYGSFPTINFSSLFGDACRRKTQKLRALFHYFNTVTDKDQKPDGLVTFERICIPPSELPHWSRQVPFLSFGCQSRRCCADF